MASKQLTARARAQLDRRFRELGPSSRFRPPVRGWIRALREALGMSQAQLGTRLGISQPAVIKLEQSEAKGTMELATLRRVAEARLDEFIRETNPRLFWEWAICSSNRTTRLHH